MSDKIKELVKKIKDLSKTEYYGIKISEEIPDIFDSKIGGLPYWTPDQVYPTNSEGKKLFLLAQINFDKDKVDTPLPKNGILQFFICDDDVMGLNFDDFTQQNNFRVIYHENIDYKITKDTISQLDIPDSKNAKCYPIFGEYKISLKKETEYANFHDIRFDNFFRIAYKEIYNKDLKDDDYYFKILNDEERKIFEKKLKKKNSLNHKMLGYSYFTQEDPRYDKKYADYDTLLLQIDTEGKYVMWGDMGIGNFFISRKSLLEKDFNKVLYNWDCY